MLIRPAKRVLGTVTIPGDKSISHRAAIIAAMAEGGSEIENFSTGADCSSTVDCLRKLGVTIEHTGTSLRVRGVGKSGFLKPDGPLDCGNSGTTMRLLAGVLAGQDFESVLDGDASLRRRPMNRIIEPLRQLGVEIDSEDGKAPLTIRGRNPLNAITYTLPVASAQVKSCVLLAGLNADGKTSVIEGISTRDHTERMLGAFGGDIYITDLDAGRNISISDSKLAAQNITVPSDISGATFFMIAAACLEGSDLRLSDVGINPTRAAIIDILRDRGVEIEAFDLDESCGEPAATLKVSGRRLPKNESFRIKGHKIAEIIDEIPILAVLGTQIEGGIEIRDASELRFKESDRITAIAENLQRMGADIEEFDDGFRVGRSKLKGAEVDSFGDHRIAMAFAVAALSADGNTTIRHAECADISFPGFYGLLESVVQR